MLFKEKRHIKDISCEDNNENRLGSIYWPLCVKYLSYKVNVITISILLVGKQRLGEKLNDMLMVTHLTIGRQAFQTQAVWAPYS